MSQLLEVRLESPALTLGAVHVFEVSGRESIGRLFEFQVNVVCSGPRGLDDEALLLAPAALVFETGGAETRRIHGMIVAVRDSLHSETQRRAYTLTLVPRAWALSLTERSEVYLDKTVQDIVREKLTATGFVEGPDFALRLLSSYPVREFVVQYKESDVAFLSRICEHLGISFFFEHDGDRDRIVFADDNSAFRPIEGPPSAAFHPRGERLGVFELEAITRVLPEKYVVRDYNYRTPNVALEGQIGVEGGRTGGVIEYGVHCKTPEEAQRLARVRAEERACRRRVFEGKSVVQAFAAGARATVEGHPRGDTELLLVEVEHRAEQPVLMSGPEQRTTYENTFRAVESAAPFRPARVTPKPRVTGAVTAIVEAEQRGDYAELDDAGRYRVRFAFDSAGHAHGKASHPIRMAQPHTGPGYGFHFPLRDGVEVAITFIEGDPDRPIIAGAVPNPTTPSTVTGRNAARNVIRTGAGTEINIDNTDGSSRVKISVPYGNTRLQLGAPNDPTKGFSMVTDNSAKFTTGGFITMEAGDSFEAQAGTYMGLRAQNVGIKAKSVVEIEGGVAITEEAPEISVTGKSFVQIVGSSFTLVFGGGSVIVASDGEVTIAAPTVSVRAATAEVNGATVNVTSSGDVNVKGGTVNLN